MYDVNSSHVESLKTEFPYSKTVSVYLTVEF